MLGRVDVAAIQLGLLTGARLAVQSYRERRVSAETFCLASGVFVPELWVSDGSAGDAACGAGGEGDEETRKGSGKTSVARVS